MRGGSGFDLPIEGTLAVQRGTFKLDRRSIANFGQKLGKHARLMIEDPELFGRNLLQRTNFRLWEARLLDMLPTPRMHARIVDSNEPRFNVLDTAWSARSMTGGPNTALNIAGHVARTGTPTRLISTSSPAAIDPAWLQVHLSTLVGATLPPIEVASASDPAAPVQVGKRDIFMATHWITAHQLRPVLHDLPNRKFFFLLQEFEAGFYPWSSNHALALEALEMDYWPVINERLLADYFFSTPFSRLSEPEMREQALVFEPAVDPAIFYPARNSARRRPRLLFYARPSNTRNMFGLGLSALRAVAGNPAFKDWEFISIGSRDSVPELTLGGGHCLRPAPWHDYAGYAELLRSADLLLCPMLSPHTSYPVLEMAACGGISVTNTFATKTRTALEGISDTIIATPPTVEGLVQGLREGEVRVRAGLEPSGLRGIPASWSQALGPLADRIAARCQEQTAAYPAH